MKSGIPDRRRAGDGPVVGPAIGVGDLADTLCARRGGKPEQFGIRDLAARGRGPILPGIADKDHPFAVDQQDFPGAHTVALTRNYRSGAKILTAALHVISPTTLVPDRVLQPMGAHKDALVGMHHAATEQAEAAFVARTIEQLLGGVSFHALDSGRVDSHGTAKLGGLSFSDFAVLYRTDRQAGAVMDALTRAGLPFRCTTARCRYGLDRSNCWGLARNRLRSAPPSLT